MRKGKILKMRPGHDANCSSSAYLGGILVGFVGYVLLLPVLAVVQSSLRTRSLGSKLGVGTLRIAWWVVPHLLVLAALLAWAFASGAMEYGSAFYVGGLALIMLIGMGVGWARIAAKSRAAQKAASICPGCGGQVIPTDSTCPWCELDLAVAREQASQPVEVEINPKLGFWLVVAGLVLPLAEIILLGRFDFLVGLLTLPLAAYFLYLSTRRVQSRYRVALLLAGLGNLSLPWLSNEAYSLPSLAMSAIAALILGFGLTRDLRRRILMVLGVLFLALSPSIWYLASSVNPINAQHLKLQYRTGRRSFQGIVLEKAELGGADLSGADLGQANLRRGDLSSADLFQADFSGADLTEADLTEADLRNASLSNAILVDVDLSGANLSAADLRSADLTGANLNEAELDRVNLKGAALDEATRMPEKQRMIWEIATQGAVGRDLSGADLSHAGLREVDLRGANLRGADLSEADLTAADLSNADLRGANLNGARLSRARLEGTMLDDTDPDGARQLLIQEIVTQGAVGRDLRDAYLVYANLAGVNLCGANLSGADLSGADLSGADLSNASLGNAMLVDVDLSRAVLSNAKLSNAVLIGVDLSRADLDGADLEAAILTGADLSYVNLLNSRVTAEQLAEAKTLKGATLPDGSVHE